MNAVQCLQLYCILGIFFPLCSAGLLGLASLVLEKLQEVYVRRLVNFIGLATCLQALVLLVATVKSSHTDLVHNFGVLYVLGDHDFDFKFCLNIPTAILLVVANLALGIVGNFSLRYMHREKNFVRFFFLFLIFFAGFNLICLGASLDLLIVGWELVGLSSIFLIGFFSRRERSVKNSLYACVVYRVTDLGLIMGAILWAHFFQHTDLPTVLADDILPKYNDHTGFAGSALVGFLLLAIAGKSAQFPFSFWLPRAMEGPTPSSAIFYGALSIHAGPLLALRLTPSLDAFSAWHIGLVTMGLSTAVFATICGRVRSDIKTQLAYASLTQVGLILVEIGFNWLTLAFVHMLGHMVYRSFQLLSAPSIIQIAQKLNLLDYKIRVPRTGIGKNPWMQNLKNAFYRQALFDFHLIEYAEYYVSGPLKMLSDFCNRIEIRLMDELFTHESPRPGALSSRAEPFKEPKEV